MRGLNGDLIPAVSSIHSFIMGDDLQLTVAQDHGEAVAGLNLVAGRKSLRYRNI
jgi:hypothetical protein